MASSASADVANALPVSHRLRSLANVVIVVLAVLAIVNVGTNPNFQWEVVGQYLTADVVLQGIVATLVLTVLCMTLGIVAGAICALARMSQVPALRALAVVYIWVFRGVPALVLCITFFNIAALYPTISVGIPFGPTFASVDTTTLVPAVVAGVLALGLHEGAYMAEIVRAGFNSVGKGQLDAAKALGLSWRFTVTRIVLPQAMRVIIPPTGGQVIGLTKATSLLSVISVHELLRSTQIIYLRTFEVIPLLVVGCIWYLIITSVMYVGQEFVERHYSASDRPVDGRPALPLNIAEA